MTTHDPQALRKAFGSFMTGVTVVTTTTEDNTPVGFTANSFTSVSLDPPLLLVCPAKSLTSFAAFLHCQHFAINILSEQQKDVSNVFAKSKDDRFSQVNWHLDSLGNPVLANVLTHFSCKVHQKIDAGDHYILIGEIIEFASQEGNGLGYSSSGYFSLGLERQAAALTAKKTNVTIGAIIEHDGKVLVNEVDGKYNLPSITTDSKTNAVLAIKQYLQQQGIAALLRTVFSVYNDRTNNVDYIFYHASADNADSNGLGHYVPITEVTNKAFVSAAMTSMMQRYREETQNGAYSVYVGTEESGDIH